MTAASETERGFLKEYLVPGLLAFITLLLTLMGAMASVALDGAKDTASKANENLEAINKSLTDLSIKVGQVVTEQSGLRRDTDKNTYDIEELKRRVYKH